MNRTRRAVLATAAVASAALAVLLLTSFSHNTEGPLATALDRLGGAVDSAEHSLRARVRGAERRKALEWLQAYRDSAARLRAPEGMLLGAYCGSELETLGKIVELEGRLKTRMPLVQIYTAWGDRAEHEFPYRSAIAIWNMGSVPVITWEPWLSVFDNVGHPRLPLRELRDHHGLAAVGRGDYDFYIDRWAAAAARFERPLFLRFAHEMNDPYRYPWGPQNNTKEEFIAAWRHVVSRFRAARADNVVWVWSPHVAHEYWDLYFPGDEYVDWVATGALNYGAIAYWSRWWTFDEIFGMKYQRLATFGKPIMIAELGSLGGGQERARWYGDALRSLDVRFPQVKALLFFHTPGDQTVTYQRVDWTVIGDDALAQTIADAIRPYDRSRSGR